MKTRKKRFVGRIEGNYLIDKKVSRDKHTGIIKFISFIPCENIKPKGAIKFYEDEKSWLEENNPEIEWEVYDA